MQNRAMQFVFFVLFTLTLFQGSPVRANPPAQGDIIAGLGVAVNRLQPNRNEAFSQNPRIVPRFGGHIMGEGHLNHFLSLQAHILFSDYQYVREFSGRTINERGTRIHVPVLFRFRLPHNVSLGLGPYASYRMGSVKEKNEWPVTPEEGTSAHDTGEHGLEFSLAYKLKISPTKYQLLIDLRHTHSLTARSGEEKNHMGLLLSLAAPVR